MANNPYIIKQMWAKGSQTVEFFETGGTEITDSNFKVDEVGTYTVFTSLVNGDKYVTELEILQEDLFIPVPTTSTIDGIVTITYPEGISPTLQKWDYGIKTIEELESNGFVVSGDAFEVSVAGEVSILYVLEGYYKFLHTFVIDESEVPVSDKPIISFVDNVATITIPEGKTAVELKYIYGESNSVEDFNRSLSIYKVYKNNKIFIDMVNKGATKSATVYYKYDDGSEGVKAFAIEDTSGAFKVKTNQTYRNFANGEILTAGYGNYMLLDKEAGIAVEMSRTIEERFNTSYGVKVYSPQSSSSIGYKENVTDFNALPQLQKENFIQNTFSNESEIGNVAGNFSARYRLISYHEIDKWIDKIMPAMKLMWMNFGGVNRWARLWTRTQVSNEVAVWGIDENGEPIKISVAYDANKGSKEYEALGVNLVQLNMYGMFNGYQSDIDYPYFEPTVTGRNGIATVKFDGKIRYQRIGYRDGQRTLAEMESVNWDLEQGGTFEITQAGWYTIFTRMLDGTGHIKQVYFDESALLNFRADHWGIGGRVKFTFSNTVPPMVNTNVRWAIGTRDVAYFANGTVGSAPIFMPEEPNSFYINPLETAEHRVTIYTKSADGKQFVEVYDLPDSYYAQPIVTVTYTEEGLVTIAPDSSLLSHIVEKRYTEGTQTALWFSSNPLNGNPIGDNYQVQAVTSGAYTFYLKFDNTFDYAQVETINITPTIFITECRTGDYIEYAGKRFIYTHENKIMFVESQGFKAFDVGGSNVFDPNNTNNIAHWLNGDFYNSLPESIKAEMVSASWNISSSSSTVENVDCIVGLIERYPILAGSGDENKAFRDATSEFISSTNYYFWAVSKSSSGAKYGSRRNSSSYSWGVTTNATTVYNTHPAIKLSDNVKVKLLKRYLV